MCVCFCKWVGGEVGRCVEPRSKCRDRVCVFPNPLFPTLNYPTHLEHGRVLVLGQNLVGQFDLWELRCGGGEEEGGMIERSRCSRRVANASRARYERSARAFARRPSAPLGMRGPAQPLAISSTQTCRPLNGHIARGRGAWVRASGAARRVTLWSALSDRRARPTNARGKKKRVGLCFPRLAPCFLGPQHQAWLLADRAWAVCTLEKKSTHTLNEGPCCAAGTLVELSSCTPTHLVLVQEGLVHVRDDVQQRVAHPQDALCQAGRHGYLVGWEVRVGGGEGGGAACRRLGASVVVWGPGF